MSIEDDPTSMADFGFAGTFEYDLGTTMIDAPGEFPDPAPLIPLSCRTVRTSIRWWSWCTAIALRY